MNSSLDGAIYAVLGAASSEQLDRVLQENADAPDVVRAVAACVREKLKLAAEIEALGRFDADTGLPNRRAFDERLDLELRRGARNRKSFALVIVELPSGDESAMPQLASAISGQVRLVDFAARISDRRCAMLLVEVDGSNSQGVVARLAQALKQARQTAVTGYTLSFPVDTAQTLFERAEAALYEQRLG